MSIRVAVNGFGRIGRLAFRHLHSTPGVDVVACNDVAPLDNLAYLLRYDSVQPRPDVPVEADGGTLRWGEREVQFLSVAEPAELPWQELGIDVVVEASGRFTKRADANGHLEAGAGKVVITAPAKGPDATICIGVNQDVYDPDNHRIVSTASCTTNCLAPVAKVLDDTFGIVQGALTTVHGYTSSQGIVDKPASKWRRGRAAAVSIVPTTTGAATATAVVLPQLEGKLDGMAMRVPVPAGSIVDFVATTERPVDVDSVNRAFRDAASSDAMRGVLGVSDDQLVSADVIGTTWSSLVDATSTMVFGDRMVKILSWYDNEWGFARRVADLVSFLAGPESFSVLAAAEPEGSGIGGTALPLPPRSETS